MHHSEKTYGKDAKAFRPERWLESDPAKLAEMVRTNELTFGHGKFQCLGKPVAQIEIGKTVFEVSKSTSTWLLERIVSRFWAIR
jgi:cytochrome P450